MKNVKMLRKVTGLSQSEFARLFKIPVGTLRNWEQNLSSCPDYVYLMIHRIVFDLVISTDRIDLIDFSKCNESVYYTLIGD